MAWYEYSEIQFIRGAVEEQLKLPPYNGPKGQRESATAFWARVERAGLLLEALALYDKEWAERMWYMHMRRETKKQFAERIEREGRQAEAECVRAELRASGMSEREIQVDLVTRLQPLDGTDTRAWETPDPWQAGRLFRRKVDQDRLLELANPDGTDDDAGYQGKQAQEARWRVECAKRRQEERRALAAARKRALVLKAGAKVSDTPNVAPRSLPEATPPPVPAPQPRHLPTQPAPASTPKPRQRTEVEKREVWLANQPPPKSPW